MTRLVAAGALVVAFGAGLLAAASAGPATAQCAAPTLQLDRTVFRVGDGVEVTGEGFVDDCYDTGQAGFPPSTTNIDVFVVQGGDEILLDTVDASHGRFVLRAAIPRGLHDGAATITTDPYGHSVPITVSGDSGAAMIEPVEVVAAAAPRRVSTHLRSGMLYGAFVGLLVVAPVSIVHRRLLMRRLPHPLHH